MRSSACAVSIRLEKTLRSSSPTLRKNCSKMFRCSCFPPTGYCFQQQVRGPTMYMFHRGKARGNSYPAIITRHVMFYIQHTKFSRYTREGLATKRSARNSQHTVSRFCGNQFVLHVFSRAVELVSSTKVAAFSFLKSAFVSQTADSVFVLIACLNWNYRRWELKREQGDC